MAADKYILNDLKSRCHEHLYKNLEPCNACGAYELAKLLDFKDFRKQAWKVSCIFKISINVVNFVCCCNFYINVLDNVFIYFYINIIT
jgi:hypothetical protein